MKVLEIEDHKDGQDKCCNYGANYIFVPVHPSCHGCQDLLASANIVIHPTKLETGGMTLTNSQELERSTEIMSSKHSSVAQ